MSGELSPSLTSTSHTLTGLSIMAPAPHVAYSSSHGPSVPQDVHLMARSLLKCLRDDTGNIKFQPTTAVPSQSLDLVKQTLEAFTGEVVELQQQRLKESRKRKRGGNQPRHKGDVLRIRQVWLDGFETGQVWQQARRVIDDVLVFSNELLLEMKATEELEDADDIAIEEDISDVNEGLDVLGNEEEEEDTDVVNDASTSQKQTHARDASIRSEGDSDENNQASEDENESAKPENFVEDADGLNDGFFSIDDFNKQSQWFEDQDYRGDPDTDRLSDDEVDWDADPLAKPESSEKSRTSRDEPTGANRAHPDEESEEDGPTFGSMALDAPEGASDDEMMDNEEKVEDGDDGVNANEIYYKDFFAPPPGRGKKGLRPRKSVRFEPSEPRTEDVDRAMDDVRRDLFDDESERSDSEDALSDASAGDPRSRRSAHERRQAKLAEEIRQLEAASVARREWAMSGEAAALDRPVNSLLEEELDFEHVGKPVPMITPETTEGIEELIKRRILAQEFDEVTRRRPDADSTTQGSRRGLLELDDRKPNKSLAEIYEEEHIKHANPETYVSQSDEKLRREETEIETMWKSICARLDALSSWHFRPKPAAPSLSVVADVGTVSLEDAQPTTAQGVSGSGSRMAPQEVYTASHGDRAANGEVVTKGGVPVARQEMSKEDKVRRRRREKERVRRAGGVRSGATISKRAQTQKDTLADLKKGGVKVINRKGEITDVQGNKARQAQKASSGSFKL